jgi:coproporphyrinogen III oxidase-like Fe-S oxidoreductase
MSDRQEAEFAQYAFDTLQDDGGYIPSNCFSLAKDRGSEHVHTRGVWDGEDLLGLGLSAYGVLNDLLYQNNWTEKEYLALVGAGHSAIRRAHRITEREKIFRTMTYGVTTTVPQARKVL